MSDRTASGGWFGVILIEFDADAESGTVNEFLAALCRELEKNDDLVVRASAQGPERSGLCADCTQHKVSA